MVKIVSFSGSFPDTSKDGVATIGFCDVINKLLDEHSFSDTSTTKKTFSKEDEG